MANEFLQLPNPDDMPGAVSSGYKRQNNNLFTLQTGLDTCEPYEEGNKVIIPAGGVVEFNGVMFKISPNQPVELTMSNPLSMQWIAIGWDDEMGTARARLVTRPGPWKPDKQGCYLSDGSRILNRFIQVKEGFVLNPNPNDKVQYEGENVPGFHSVYLRKGWYLIILKSGKGGVNGTAGSSSGYGQGGIASQGTQKEIRRFLFIGENRYCNVYVGKGGAPGDNSSYGGGGGGGSGGGEASVFETLDTGFVLGGRGGDSIDVYNHPDDFNYGKFTGNILGGDGGNYGPSSSNTTIRKGGKGGWLKDDDSSVNGLCQIYKWW